MKVNMVTDSIAEKLEENEFWHRAATRWLAVFQNCQDEQCRIWIAIRRTFCMKKARGRRRVNGYENFDDVRKAADALLRSWCLREDGKGLC